MGYYLNMTGKSEDVSFDCLGGKFYGYLDVVFDKCVSAKFLAAVDMDSYELLNVCWSCVSFELNSVGAEIFLTLYKNDVEKFKENPYLESIDEALEYIRTHEFQIYEFSMG